MLLEVRSHKMEGLAVLDSFWKPGEETMVIYAHLDALPLKTPTQAHLQHCLACVGEHTHSLKESDSPPLEGLPSSSPPSTLFGKHTSKSLTPLTGP